MRGWALGNGGPLHWSKTMSTQRLTLADMQDGAEDDLDNPLRAATDRMPAAKPGTPARPYRPYRHAERRRIRAAIRYWANCLGKGTNEQRALTERTIHELSTRLEALG